jgi:hypothetical protein
MIKTKFVFVCGQLIEPLNTAESFGGIGPRHADKQRGSPEHRDCLL